METLVFIVLIITVVINIILLITFLVMASNVKKIKKYLINPDLIGLAKVEIELKNYRKAIEYLKRAKAKIKIGSFGTTTYYAQIHEINALLKSIEDYEDQSLEN